MIRIFFFMLGTTFFLSVSSTVVHAQSAEASNEDAQLSMTISRHILKLVNTLTKTKNLSPLKGELLSSNKDGSKSYAVKEMDSIMATTQYILVKKGGTASYVATYSGDVKLRTMSFSAFLKGVTAIARSEDELVVVTDTKNSGGTKLAYIMKQKGVQVATYTLDLEKKEGILIVGF